MPSDTQSTRVQMPPSYSGARASIATQWLCVGSPMASAPLAIRPLEYYAPVEARAADREAVGRPFAALVAAPGLTQPLSVGLEATAGDDAGAGLDAFLAHVGSDEATAVELEPVHRCVVADLHP